LTKKFIDRLLELTNSDPLWVKFLDDAEETYKPLSDLIEKFETKYSDNDKFSLILSLPFDLAKLFIQDYIVLKKLENKYGLSYSFGQYLKFWVMPKIRANKTTLIFRPPEYETGYGLSYSFGQYLKFWVMPKIRANKTTLIFRSPEDKTGFLLRFA
jgi:hypothetical protein